MKETSMRQTFVSALVLATVLIGCDAGATRDDADQPNRGSADAGDAAYDLRFVDTMNAHHQHGIEMAQMAVEKGSPEVKAMAEKMIAEQKADQESLQSLRQLLYGAVPEARDMSLPGASSMEMDMSQLQTASGADFDRLFLEMMVPHHQGAVAMGRDAVAKAESESIRQKAQEIAEKQEGEIAALQGMQSQVAAL
jgi:uncharacterized protein (DUF305 family)